jgi:hypothetical protein
MGSESAVPTRSTKRSRGRATHVDSRANETRAQVDRSVEHDRELENKPYIRPTSLQAPAARPGYRQRWVNVGVEGKWDERNWAKKQREGWLPRQVSTVPKNFQVPRIHSGRFSGCVGVEGMILCEMTVAQNNKRRAFYEGLTQRKTKAVDEDIRRVNRVAGGGFGPIKKGEASKLVREKTIAGAEDGDGEGLDL